MREEILSLLSGQNIDTVPVFSGLIHMTAEGLKHEGLALHEVHHDANKMARAAASTYKLTGMPSGALALDLCAPTEALGAELIFYNDAETQFSQVKKLLFMSTREVSEFSPKLGGRIRTGQACSWRMRENLPPALPEDLWTRRRRKRRPVRRLI